jgi:hypothetical protein
MSRLRASPMIVCGMALTSSAPASPALVDEQLADQLLGKAQAEGMELLGPDGLLSQVTKAVLERALAEEMTGHLGYDKHDPAGRGSGNRQVRQRMLIDHVPFLAPHQHSSHRFVSSYRVRHAGLPGARMNDL